MFLSVVVPLSKAFGGGIFPAIVTTWTACLGGVHSPQIASVDSTDVSCKLDSTAFVCVCVFVGSLFPFPLLSLSVYKVDSQSLRISTNLSLKLTHFQLVWMSLPKASSCLFTPTCVVLLTAIVACLSFHVLSECTVGAPTNIMVALP